jgi:hypothetical protein
VKKSSIKSLIVFLALCAYVILGIVDNMPPNPVSKSAAPTLFSAERAMQHLAFIAEKPHPIGSGQHANEIT